MRLAWSFRGELQKRMAALELGLQYRQSFAYFFVYNGVGNKTVVSFHN